MMEKVERNADILDNVKLIDDPKPTIEITKLKFKNHTLYFKGINYANSPITIKYDDQDVLTTKQNQKYFSYHFPFRGYKNFSIENENFKHIISKYDYATDTPEIMKSAFGKRYWKLTIKTPKHSLVKLTLGIKTYTLKSHFKTEITFKIPIKEVGRNKKFNIYATKKGLKTSPNLIAIIKK